MHSMGINDMIFAGADELVTCSSDRTVKRWKIVENKALEQNKVLQISEADSSEYKENVEKQQLGLAFHPESGSIFAVNYNSDINCWGKDVEVPDKTIRGHSNTVGTITSLADKFIVSGDNDGRILLWNSETGEASRPSGVYKHKIVIVGLTSHGDNLYSASGDMHMGHFTLSDGVLKSQKLV